MSAASNKLLIRVLPIGVLLAVAVTAGLRFSPGTFKYRAWPKAPTSAPIRSLVDPGEGIGGRPALGLGPRPFAIASLPPARSTTPSSAVVGGSPARLSARRSMRAGVPPAIGPTGAGQGSGNKPSSGSAQTDRRRSGQSRDSSGGLVKSAPAPKSGQPTVAAARRMVDSARSSYAGTPRHFEHTDYARRPSEHARRYDYRPAPYRPAPVHREYSNEERGARPAAPAYRPERSVEPRAVEAYSGEGRRETGHEGGFHGAGRNG